MPRSGVRRAPRIHEPSHSQRLVLRLLRRGRARCCDGWPRHDRQPQSLQLRSEVELARRAVNLRIHLGRLVVALCRVFRLEELPKALYLLPHLLLGSVQEVAHAPHLHG